MLTLVTWLRADEQKIAHKTRGGVKFAFPAVAGNPLTRFRPNYFGSKKLGWYFLGHVPLI
jgi:hypothetical protein